MKLSEAGESRVNGYLFVLERSLVTSLPKDVARDAVREIDSHLRDRIAAANAIPDERTSLETILSALGSPQRVAQAYSLERSVDEAVGTGKVVAILRAVGHVALSGISGFFAALFLFIGYVIGAAFLILALLKPIFPNNVGFWVPDDPGSKAFDLAFRGGVGPGPWHEHLVGGYWVIPICLVVGFGLLFLSHRGARKFLGWWRRRHPSFAATARPAL